jgi:Xaa-Pro aminopeptidase
LTETKRRRDALAATFAAERIGVILITHLPNVRYLTGFTGSNALLLLGPGWASLYTDPRYDLQAASQCDCPVKIVQGPLIPEAVKEIRKRRTRRLGIEGDRLTYQQGLELVSALGKRVEIKPLTGLVERLRAIKSASEIRAIRKSVLLNSLALENALKQLRPGMTERQLAARIGFEMRQLGAEGESFPAIVASGPHSALPHAEPRAIAIKPGRFLLIDMGASLDGYASDMTRTFHLGEPSRKARDLYCAVLEAQLAAIDAVRPGALAADVDAAARNVLRLKGMAGFFRHSTGHGLGLEIHESPRLGEKSKEVLAAGMAITIEPGAYLPGFGGVRIEDTVMVTGRGCEVLTPTPKELLVITA